MYACNKLCRFEGFREVVAFGFSFANEVLYRPSLAKVPPRAEESEEHARARLFHAWHS